MTSKHPNCECQEKRYEYFRKRYRNQTLHLIRRCAECGKTAQNCMPMRDYDRAWVETLPIMENGVMEQPVQSVKPNLKSRADTVKSRANPVQSRADAIMKKLQRHIENRSL